MYLFNEKMVHLVDDIFWHLGFRSAEHAEEVTCQSLYFDYFTYFAYFNFQIFQVRIENSIPESTWATKREAIANEIYELGVGYRKKVRDGWVTYLEAKYAATGAPIHRRVDAVTAQKRVVDDDDA